ncbi:MAG: U32 family peptidase [Bacteroidales bacterium]|nr:U32 family peptidase [Bacteroidales bacterium]
MQLTSLELLAPAKNKDIGIAAIDCGADAVYIAGPSFGAREAAGNPVEDIAVLAEYAHRFGAKVYATVNTLLREEELPQAAALVRDLYKADADAILVQDYRLLQQDLPPIELHASTQAVCRTPQQASALEALGFRRLVLERQLSLDQIRAIREAVTCELEFFVHGALCVCYSGECFLSEHLTDRSANRGACIQACRSLYDLEDASGKTLVRNYPLLSLKDYRLDGHITELAEAGICSFKIEGRLKNESYVRNTVRHYSIVLDKFIKEHPQYRRASAGRVEGGFTPNLQATFNRGYTDLFIDGERGRWLSGDNTKSKGEYAGRIVAKGENWIELDGMLALNNGDGLCTVKDNGEQTGFRADKCIGDRIEIKTAEGLNVGQEIWRNYNIAFEKQLRSDSPERLIDVTVDFSADSVTAVSAAGASVTLSIKGDYPPARNIASAVDNIRRQMSKRAGVYSFHVMSVDDTDVRFYPLSVLNGFRRDLAGMLDARMAQIMSAGRKTDRPAAAPLPPQKRLAQDGELMRSKYCIRYELGLCPKYGKRTDGRLLKASCKEPLFLVNNGRRLRLAFDCKACEMSVLACD